MRFIMMDRLKTMFREQLSIGFALAIFIIGIVFSPGGLAQEKKPSKTRKSRIVDVDFNDELQVRGKLLGPSIFTIYHKDNLMYGKLIKPKANFLQEMRETAIDIK